MGVLAGYTSGVEPIFAPSYTRRSESLSERKFAIVHSLVEMRRVWVSRVLKVKKKAV